MNTQKIEKILIQELIEKSMSDNYIQEFTLHNIVKLAGDASTRKYFRASDVDNHVSYVVCLDEIKDVEEKHAFLEMQKILEINNVRVPKIFAYYLDRGFILQEDLGDTTFLKRLADCNDRKEEFELYLKAIDLLINIQTVDVNAPYCKDAPFKNLYFDQKKLMQEVTFTKIYFFEKFLGHNLTCEQNDIIDNEYLKMCRILGNMSVAPAMCLTHRDYHSRNLMMKNDDLVVIDFQDARHGFPQYDLVSLLEDCYYQIDENNKTRLMKYYYEQFRCAQSMEEFEYIYRLASVQRIFKAIGSFSYIYETRGDFRYVKYIGHAFERLKLYLDDLSEFRELKKTLAQIYYAY